MTRILFKFIIYPTCEKASKNVRVKSKIGNRLLVTWFFWLHMIIYDSFSSVFCIVPKNILLLKYRKWVSHLQSGYHYAKVVENARINISVSPYCTLLFSKRKPQIFGSSLISCSLNMCSLNPVGCIMNMWGYWTFTCFLKTAVKHSNKV